MSLINKMLQDLEARRSEGSGRETIHAQVRVVPEKSVSRLPWLFLSTFLIALVAVASWYWMREFASVGSMPPVAAPSQQPSLPPGLSLKLASELNSINAESTAQTAENGNTPPINDIPPASSAAESGGSFSGGSQAIEQQSTHAAFSENGKTDTPPANTAGALPSTAARSDESRNAGTAFAGSVVKTANAESTPSSLPAKEKAARVSAANASLSPLDSSPDNSPNRQRALAKDKSVQALKATSQGTVPVASEMQNRQEIETYPVKQIKEMSPHQRAENEYRRAGLLMQQQRREEAITVLEHALQIDPQHSAARQTLAGLLVDAKRTDDAIRKLEEGLALDRTQPALAMMLARLQVEKKELKPAIDTLQRTLPHAADRADYQAFMAALYQRESRHKDAIEHYLIALRKSPQNGLWWMGLAISLQADNRIADAREAYQRAKSSNMLSADLAIFVDQRLAQLR